MPGRVDHCWTTPGVCTTGDFEPSQRHSYYKWLVAQGLYWNRGGGGGGAAICHACPTVSITSKDFTRFQIVLQNPSVKLEIQCAFIHLPINYIRNISCDNSLQFLTDVVQRMGVFRKLIQCTMPILSSIPSPCIIPSMCFAPLSFSLSPCCFSG